MKLKFWEKTYSVCSECGVHFEPVTGYESRWGNLCSVHRKPVKERDEKKDAVIAWASANWERLAKIMEKENSYQSAEYNQAIQEKYQDYYNNLENSKNHLIHYSLMNILKVC